MVNRQLMGWLGKEAAALCRNTTSRSKTVSVGDGKGLLEAQKVLNDDPPPAAHHAPTRYGRKPYSRGMERDSS